MTLSFWQEIIKNDETHPLISCAVKEEDAEAQHTVHDGEGAVQSNILKRASH